MGKLVCTMLAAVLCSGCATKQHWMQGTARTGTISVADAPPQASFCIDGLMRKWRHAECSTIEYRVIDNGYIKYNCIDPLSESSGNPLYDNDYFVILWIPEMHAYSQPIPETTNAICGDESAILVMSERD